MISLTKKDLATLLGTAVALAALAWTFSAALKHTRSIERNNVFNFCISRHPIPDCEELIKRYQFHE